MICHQCISAERDPQIGVFNSYCKECTARHLAQGLEFWNSQRAGRLTLEYRVALERSFGTEWELWHGRVKSWAKKLKRS